MLILILAFIPNFIHLFSIPIVLSVFDTDYLLQSSISVFIFIFIPIFYSQFLYPYFITCFLYNFLYLFFYLYFYTYFITYFFISFPISVFFVSIFIPIFFFAYMPQKIHHILHTFPIFEVKLSKNHFHQKEIHSF